jgi:hypothetical protein
MHTRSTLPVLSGAALLSMALAAAGLAASPPPSGTATEGAGAASPGPIDSANFTATVDNPWYSLIPGTTFRYEGIKDGQEAVDTFEVTSETATIDGVPVVVVKDSLTLDGKLAEETTDWFSQDLEGNVWYFGEDTRTLRPDGTVSSTEGTWRTGVDGASPGIFMPAQPQIGDSFQQEHLPGQAEDRFVVTQIGVPVQVPLGDYPDAMLTVEWTPLEPDVLSQKAYVRGIGQVMEADLTGSEERLELVRITQP